MPRDPFYKAWDWMLYSGTGAYASAVLFSIRRVDSPVQYKLICFVAPGVMAGLIGLALLGGLRFSLWATLFAVLLLSAISFMAQQLLSINRGLPSWVP